MRPPHFWSAGLDPGSREAAPLVRLLLTPFASLYAWASARRIAKASPEKVAIPVICIGNITSGGSGKTPIVKALREALTAKGYKAASLSRGYGGRLKGPLLVDPNTHTAKDVGDEPLMLAHSGESWIGADRVSAAREMATAGIDVILMDDGHQNPSLYKDMSLLVLDAGAPFGNGHVLPKGPLREPIAASLKRADGVILMGDGPVPQIVTVSKLPVLRAHLESLAPPPPGPLIAFAGIGRPQRFFDKLEQAGGDVMDTLSFADHHTYSDRELQRLHEVAKVHSAQLVTTEKDYMRLAPAQREGIHAIRVRTVFDGEADLLARILPILEGERE